MLTIGVDLAAEPEGTAIAQLEWSAGGANLRDVVIGADDDRIIEAIRQAHKAGIDCPLGWPVPFVEFVTAHQRGNVRVPPDLPGRGTDQLDAARSEGWIAILTSPISDLQE